MGDRLEFQKKKILVVAPNNWSAQELSRYSNRYEYIFVEDQFQKEGISFLHWLRLIWGLDFQKGVAKLAHLAKKHGADGIIGADDFISCVYASAAARSLGLPGAVTELELTFQHKYYSRILQKKFVPEMVPGFQLLDFKQPPKFPFFAKPVRGSASIMAKRIYSDEELIQYREMPFLKWFTYKRLIALFQGVAEQVAKISPVSAMAVAEDIIEGQQCTLEGFVYHGKNHIIGVTDSEMYPNSKLSFARFNFPSVLPRKAQQKMSEAAETLIMCSGFSFGFYNIEFFYNPKTGDVKIIEINPRMAFQFTDLYEKVLGINTFDLLLKMTIGDDISKELVKPGKVGRYKKATSFVLRSFTDAKVISVPSEEQVQAVCRDIQDSRVLIQAKPGTILSDDIFQDVESFRLATINLGGNSEEELISKYKAALSTLPFVLEPKPAMIPMLQEDIQSEAV